MATVGADPELGDDELEEPDKELLLPDEELPSDDSLGALQFVEAMAIKVRATILACSFIFRC